MFRNYLFLCELWKKFIRQWPETVDRFGDGFRDPHMRKIGYLLLVIGLALMVGSFFFPVTVVRDAADLVHSAVAGVRGMSDEEARAYLIAAFAPQSPVANLDKMAIRSMISQSGCALAIIGAVFAAMGERRLS